MPPPAEENLAALEGAPAPWGQVGSLLRAVAALALSGAEAGQRPLPPVPSGLPDELQQLLQALKDQLGA